MKNSIAGDLLPRRSMHENKAEKLVQIYCVKNLRNSQCNIWTLSLYSGLMKVYYTHTAVNYNNAIAQFLVLKEILLQAPK